jgi:NTP pyrophosphatase (non-canonical NTP hydrolase)
MTEKKYTNKEIKELLKKLQDVPCDMCGKKPTVVSEYSPAFNRNLCSNCHEKLIVDTMTFNDAKNRVRQLVKEKGFPNDKSALTQKLLWAFVELGEASDAYKKGEPWEKVAEECIDVFFYVLDFLGLAEQECNEHFDLNKIFYEKWKKNMKREDQYGQRRDIIQETWKNVNTKSRI